MFCTQCGNENLNDAKFCKSCGASIESPSVQSNPNQNNIPSATSNSAETEYASFWRRGAATIVDYQLIGATYIALSKMFGDGPGNTSMTFDVAFILLALTALSLNGSRETLSKRIFRISVLRSDKTNPSFMRSFGRTTVAFVTAGLGFFIQPFTEKKQALNDIITDCIVVQRQKGRDGLVVAAWAIQILLLMAIVYLYSHAEGSVSNATSQNNNAIATEAVPTNIPAQQNNSNPENTFSQVTPQPESTDGNCKKNEAYYDINSTQVNIRGKLISAKGMLPDEKPIIYPALQLEVPIVITGQNDLGENETTVSLMQLVLSGEKQWSLYKQSIGADARVNGTLFFAQNGNHQTEVLLTVNNIEISKDVCSH